MKCDVCKKTIGETFLKKILGTIVKDAKGKQHPVCFECQKNLKNDKAAMLEQM